MERQYQICSRCIMDTSDPNIVFDHEGICNHCRTYEQSVKNALFTGPDGKRRLELIVNQIRSEGKGKKYDCIMGVSGGVDSTYTAHLAKKMGLRPLAVHLDNGWDSELAVKNVQNMLEILQIDLYTCVLDWDEFKNLQLAFLRASVPDLEIPSDHAIVSVLYKVAIENGVKYFISGSNLATESHLPQAWSTGHRDWKYIKGINQRFGVQKLKTFPHHSVADLAYYKLFKRHQTINILNYIDYVKEEAMDTLKKDLNWQYYGGKHYESIYTRFIQGYILPVKFGFDKRRNHMSTLICSGQISREYAMEEIKKDPYPSAQMLQDDIEFVKRKLDLSYSEFETLMKLPNKTFWDYPSYEKDWLFKLGTKIYLKSRIPSN